LVFETFRRIGSASATVKYFRKNGLKFPRKSSKELTKDDMIWGELAYHRVLQILHNPRYAGIFFFGRIKTRKLADGTMKYEKLPVEECLVIKKDVHEGYIPWQEYQENLRGLRENSQAHSLDRRQSPPKEGPALLQGLAICGICGKRRPFATIQEGASKSSKIPELRPDFFP